MATITKALIKESPWERQPGESVQAYARFLAYRDQPADSRSMRKLGISDTLAFRWAKRWSWTLRVRAWEDHLLVAVESLGVGASIRLRARQLEVGHAFLTASEAAVRSLDPSKVGPESAVALVDAGSRHARQALDLAESNQTKRSDTSPIGVAVHVAGHAQVGFAPSWLPRAPESATPVSFAAAPPPKQKETSSRAGSLRLAERIKTQAQQNETNAND